MSVVLLLACSQAAASILIGVLLIQRGRRGWGGVLVGLGGVIALLAVGSLFLRR